MRNLIATLLYVVCIAHAPLAWPNAQAKQSIEYQVVSEAIDKAFQANTFAGNPTYLYAYSIYQSTGYVQYLGMQLLSYDNYTTSNTPIAIKSGFGCSYLAEFSGSIVSPQYANLRLPVYWCPNYNMYMGYGYMLGSTYVPAIFVYFVK